MAEVELALALFYDTGIWPPLARKQMPTLRNLWMRVEYAVAGRRVEDSQQRLTWPARGPDRNSPIGCCSASAAGLIKNPDDYVVGHALMGSQTYFYSEKFFLV